MYSNTSYSVMSICENTSEDGSGSWRTLLLTKLHPQILTLQPTPNFLSLCSFGVFGIFSVYSSLQELTALQLTFWVATVWVRGKNIPWWLKQIMCVGLCKLSKAVQRIALLSIASSYSPSLCHTAKLSLLACFIFHLQSCFSKKINKIRYYKNIVVAHLYSLCHFYGILLKYHFIKQFLAWCIFDPV